VPEPKSPHKPPEKASVAQGEKTGPAKVAQHELVAALYSALPWDGSSEGGRQVVERWLEENKPEEAKDESEA
jgi:hypothetical protein